MIAAGLVVVGLVFSAAAEAAEQGLQQSLFIRELWRPEWDRDYLQHRRWVDDIPIRVGYLIRWSRAALPSNWDELRDQQLQLRVRWSDCENATRAECVIFRSQREPQSTETQLSWAKLPATRELWEVAVEKALFEQFVLPRRWEWVQFNASQHLQRSAAWLRDQPVRLSELKLWSSPEAVQQARESWLRIQFLLEWIQSRHPNQTQCRWNQAPIRQWFDLIQLHSLQKMLELCR